MSFLSVLVFAMTGSITGQWQFYKMVYRGNELPPRDPNLVLQYTFEESGESLLYWTYQNDPNVRCERKGLYELKQGLLKDEVTWVEPSNHASCAQDPDMQLGHVTQAPTELLENGDLSLEIPFNEEVLYYIWKRINN